MRWSLAVIVYTARHAEEPTVCRSNSNVFLDTLAAKSRKLIVMRCFFVLVMLKIIGALAAEPRIGGGVVSKTGPTTPRYALDP